MLPFCSRLALVLALLSIASCRKEAERKPTQSATEENEEVDKTPPTPPAKVATRPNRFRVEGAEDGVVVGALASFSAGPDGALRKLELSAPPEYRQKNKRSYVVQLFFPTGFKAKAGSFAVAPDYRNKTDALGGSVVVLSDSVKVFAYEPEGEVTFTGANAQALSGRFRFAVKDGGRAEANPKTVTASGQFEATRAIPAPRKP